MRGARRPGATASGRPKETENNFSVSNAATRAPAHDSAASLLNRPRKPHDFREFLFTATGQDTDPGALTAIDLVDNLVCEFDRIGAVTELLENSNDALDVDALGGIALLLRDCHHRMRKILRVFQDSSHPGNRRGTDGE